MNQDVSADERKTPETVHESAWSKLSKFRLGLSDLFVIVAFCAGLSLVYSNSWALPFATLLAISLSLTIGFLFVMGGLGKRNPSLMLIWLFLFGVVLGCVASSGLFWVSLAHAVGAILLCFVPREFRTPRLLMRSSMVLVVLALIYWTIETPYHLNRLVEARINYPIEDISVRLDFEHGAVDEKLAEDSIPEFTLAAKVESRLRASELANQNRENYYGRVVQLKKIHDEEYERFVRQMGFGAVRMRGIGHSIETPELRSIGFALALVEEKNQDWNWLLYQNDVPPVVRLGQVSELSDLHFASESDFLNSNMFGFVAKARPERVHAVGFLPHAFHDGLEVKKTAKFESLQLQKLELVSLLKFDKPKAYVLDHLPRMDELSKEGITTRELTQFELNALDRLRSDENVVIEQGDDGIVMMGSLRSGTHCLECHAGSRGELLGAFSYEFVTKD